MYAVIFGSVAVMLPAIDLLSQSMVGTGLQAVVLVSASIWLFRHRRKLRASFVFPLCYVALLAGFRVRVTEGIDAAGFTASIIGFVVLCVAGLITEAFWNARADDLADMEYLSRFKD
jgi:hypothetical protein